MIKKSETEKKDKRHKMVMGFSLTFIAILFITCIVGLSLDAKEYNSSTPEEYLNLDEGTMEESATLVHWIIKRLFATFILTCIALVLLFWEGHRNYKLKKELKLQLNED